MYDWISKSFSSLGMLFLQAMSMNDTYFQVLTCNQAFIQVKSFARLDLVCGSSRSPRLPILSMGVTLNFHAPRKISF